MRMLQRIHVLATSSLYAYRRQALRWSRIEYDHIRARVRRHKSRVHLSRANYMLTNHNSCNLDMETTTLRCTHTHTSKRHVLTLRVYRASHMIVFGKWSCDSHSEANLSPHPPHAHSMALTQQPKTIIIIGATWKKTRKHWSIVFRAHTPPTLIFGIKIVDHELKSMGSRCSFIIFRSIQPYIAHK